MEPIECAHHPNIVFEITATTRRKTMRQIWTAQDGREMRLSDIPLDHLLNIVNDINFRVAGMRTEGLRMLGGDDNVNLNHRTVDAFLNVTPHDVFPLWKPIVKRAKQLFFEEYQVNFDDVRAAVHSAWEHGTTVPADMRRAVEFYLCRDRASTTLPHRTVHYLKTFRVDGDEAYRTMCWNLRIDQKEMWERIASHSAVPLLRMIKTVPPNRLKTAFSFEQPRRPVSKAGGGGHKNAAGFAVPRDHALAKV